MKNISLFAEVILPLSIKGTYTYCVPTEYRDAIKIGQIVVVRLGRKKNYTAIVKSIHSNAPIFEVKNIIDILDLKPVVNEKQLTFWDWISKYYLCNLGEVMIAALPPSFKLESETTVLINPLFDGDFTDLNVIENKIFEAVASNNNLTVSEIIDITSINNIFPLLKTLVEKGILITKEEITEVYKPHFVKYIKLKSEFSNEENLKKIFDELEKRAFKQLQLLQHFMKLSNFFENFKNEVSKKELFNNNLFNDEHLKPLIKKGVFEVIEKIESRLEATESWANVDEIILSEQQQKAFDEIKLGFESKNVVLLHGVTSSGKTELYIRLIEETIKKGKQVLFLLPEIALTIQIINKLCKYFGNKVGVYHSKYSEFQKVEVWNRVNFIDEEDDCENYEIIIGARSAIFLPYSNLGLIIVDEEHDSSYKQYDTSPRYNARDSAIYLAGIHNCKVILGSATPSIETFFNSLSGKFHLVNINERYGGIELPEIIISDLKLEKKNKTMHSHFSSLLLKSIEKALEENQQIILFQNRRGFSLRLECDDCYYIPHCKNCDVSMIYHKFLNQLRCHYCGYSTKIPPKCPECDSSALLMKGFGTEKIEEELQIFFPNINISRMDLDTTRSKNSYRKIISDFENRKIDILVGTQMITKGLDFDNVGVVGVINADSLWSFPDFRSYERSFQLIMQVSGRAGRKKERGKVIIQTYKPEHSIIQHIISNDYITFFYSQLNERQKFNFPPYYRIIKITLKHKKSDILNIAAKEIAEILRKSLPDKILGPEYPVVSRIKNIFLKDILIKIERSSNLNKSKTTLLDCLENPEKNKWYSKIKWSIDVDPA